MLRRISAITQKEFIQLLRFPILLIGLTVGVVVELILFAVAIHSNVNHIPMVVSDQSLSEASRSYLTCAGYFSHPPSNVRESGWK
jgi:drug efflux transport system permease protein